MLTVIQGEGLLLTVDDRMLALDAASPPWPFRAKRRSPRAPDRRPDQRPERHGPTRRLRARTRRLTVAGASDVAARARVTLVLALDSLRVLRPGGAVDLSPLDAVLLENGHSHLSLEGRGRTLISEITVDPEHPLSKAWNIL